MSDHAAAARSTMAGGLGTRSRIRSYRYALAPSRLQEDQLRSHCGAQRFAYNWGLAQVKANLEQRSAESTYGICGKDLTPALNWSAYAMRRIWNRVKSDIAPWWQENSKEAYSSGLANLATALRNWAASATKRRQGAAGRISAIQVEEESTLVLVHDGCARACRQRPAARQTPSNRHRQNPRIHSQARATPRERFGPNQISHRCLRRWALVRLLLCRVAGHICIRCSVEGHGRSGCRNPPPRGSVDPPRARLSDASGLIANPRAPRRRHQEVAPPTAEDCEEGRPGQAGRYHPVGSMAPRAR